MATDSSFVTAADPSGWTVARKPTSEKQPAGGSTGGSISGVSGAIEAEAQNEESPVFAGKTGLSIVQDSVGNYYLMGDEGLEPPTSSV